MLVILLAESAEMLVILSTCSLLTNLEAFVHIDHFSHFFQIFVAVQKKIGVHLFLTFSISLLVYLLSAE